MPTLDEEIARQLQQAADSGELRSARSYGQPMQESEGWHETPEALRMPFKILKDAGVVPHEVEMFHERARLRAAVEAADSLQTRSPCSASSASWSRACLCGSSPCASTTRCDAMNPGVIS